MKESNWADDTVSARVGKPYQIMEEWGRACSTWETGRPLREGTIRLKREEVGVGVELEVLGSWKRQKLTQEENRGNVLMWRLG